MQGLQEGSVHHYRPEDSSRHIGVTYTSGMVAANSRPWTSCGAAACRQTASTTRQVLQLLAAEPNDVILHKHACMHACMM